MKKLFTIIFLICLSVFVCGAGKNELKADIATLENGSYSVKVKGSDTEYIFPRNDNLSSQQSLTGLNKGIARLKAEDLFSAHSLSQMEKHSVKVSVDKIEKVDDSILYITFTFANKGKQYHTRQIVANMVYDKEKIAQATEGRQIKPTVYWGDVSFAPGENKDSEDDDLFMLSGGGRTYILNAADYSDTGVCLDYFFISDVRLITIDVLPTDYGYISAYVGFDTQGFVRFDKSGKVIKNYPLETWDSTHHHILGCIDTRCPRYGSFYNKFTVNNDYYLGQAEDYIIVKQSNDSWSGIVYIYDTADDMLYSVTDCRYNTTKTREYHLLAADNATDFYKLPGGSNVYFAVANTNGVYRRVKFSDEKLGLMGSGTMKIAEESGQVDFSLENIKGDIHIDFENRIAEVVSVEFEIKNHDDMVAENQTHAVYRTGGYDGRGIYNNIYLLQEKSTGATKYLATVKKQHRENTAGFTAKGDVYLLAYDGYRLFSTDMEQNGYYFKLGDNFTFGENPQENLHKRDLLAVSFNRDNSTYGAVYYRQPYYENSAVPFLSWDYKKLKATYNVGIFDAEGRLIKNYDTGVNVCHSAAGVSPVKIETYNGEKIRFTSWLTDPDRHGDIITVDLNSGAVSVQQVISADREGNYMLIPGKDKLFYGRSMSLYNKRTGEESVFAVTTFDEREQDVAGFMSDGMVYMRSIDVYEVVNIYRELVWKLGNDDFMFGNRYLDDGRLFTRWIECVSRDYGGNPSAALYYEFYDDNRGYKINSYQNNYTYKVAILSEGGKVEQTYETNLNVFPDSTVTVYNRRNDRVMIKTENAGRVLSLGYIDLETGLYNPIAGFLG